MTTLMEMMQSTQKRLVAFGGSRVYPCMRTDPTHPHIDLREMNQVTRWCRQFGATHLELCSAVEKVGNDATAVQRVLRRR